MHSNGMNVTTVCIINKQASKQGNKQTMLPSSVLNHDEHWQQLNF